MGELKNNMTSIELYCIEEYNKFKDKEHNNVVSLVNDEYNLLDEIEHIYVNDDFRTMIELKIVCIFKRKFKKLIAESENR